MSFPSTLASYYIKYHITLKQPVTFQLHRQDLHWNSVVRMTQQNHYMMRLHTLLATSSNQCHYFLINVIKSYQVSKSQSPVIGCCEGIVPRACKDSKSKHVIPCWPPTHKAPLKTRKQFTGPSHSPPKRNAKAWCKYYLWCGFPSLKTRHYFTAPPKGSGG